MSENYDAIAARHYAAYRPPLHSLILGRVLHSGERFQLGLDIGCGTGYSAVALAAFCDRVIGLDPSAAMLASASPHPAVEYCRGDGEHLGTVPMRQCGIVTFAGSLHYAKSDALRRELLRTCPVGCVIVCYDFNVLSHDILTELGVAQRIVDSGYDHRVNCSGWSGFVEEFVDQGRVDLEVTVSDIAHGLLADSNQHRALIGKYADADPFERLVADLLSRGRKPILSADIFFSRYRVDPSRGE